MFQKFLNKPFTFQALNYLLTNGEDAASLKLATACVAESNNEHLKKKLINFFLGEADGIPKVTD